MSAPLLQRPAPTRLGASSPRGTVPGSLWELTKPRLSFLSVLTTLAGYYAARPAHDPARLAWLVAGTALSAGGALALNQWWERGTDCIMERTRSRPLPAGRISPGAALAWGLGLAASGVAVLALAVGLQPAAWSAATILLYVLAYTPLKRRTRWATELGSVPGALPPLIGWAAAQGPIEAAGWCLFALLLLWQMPHFFAVGWYCRNEYRAAGFPLLPVADASGRATASWALGYAVLLAAAALLPWALGLCGTAYLVAAAALNAGFLALALRFLAERQARDAAARALFLGSLAYLPLQLGVFLADRLWLGPAAGS